MYVRNILLWRFDCLIPAVIQGFFLDFFRDIFTFGKQVSWLEVTLEIKELYTSLTFSEQ